MNTMMPPGARHVLALFVFAAAGGLTSLNSRGSVEAFSAPPRWTTTKRMVRRRNPQLLSVIATRGPTAFRAEPEYEDTWKRKRIADLQSDTARDLRVDTLTDLFAPDSIQRNRNVMNPDASYGAVFQLDGVVLDLLPLKRALWGAVAAEFAASPAVEALATAAAGSGASTSGLSGTLPSKAALPTPDDTALKQSNGLPPDEAIRKCFDWVNPVRDGSAAATADVEKYSLVHAQVQQRAFAQIAKAQEEAKSGSSSTEPLGAVLATPSTLSGASRWGIEVDELPGSRGGREEAGSEHIITRPPRRSAAATGVATATTVERPKTRNRWSADTTSDEQVAANVARALRDTRVMPGFTQWVDVLRSASVPCAVVSSYPLATVRAALQAAGLWEDYFEVAPPPEPQAPAQEDEEDDIGFGAFASSSPSSASNGIVTSRGFGNGQPVALVCAESGRGRMPQLYLGASLALERPPCKCAVFDCGPAAMMAAHEADMRGVAVRQSSAYRPSDLSVADLQVNSLEDLRLLNVRALFADRVDPWDANEPQLQLEPVPERERVARKTMSRWAD